jgi:hypothetical protein
MRYHCVVCDWTTDTDEMSKNGDEMGKNRLEHAAIDHHLATGHPIVSERIYLDSSESDYRVQKDLK